MGGFSLWCAPREASCLLRIFFDYRFGLGLGDLCRNRVGASTKSKLEVAGRMPILDLSSPPTEGGRKNSRKETSKSTTLYRIFYDTASFKSMSHTEIIPTLGTS